MRRQAAGVGETGRQVDLQANANPLTTSSGRVFVTAAGSDSS